MTVNLNTDISSQEMGLFQAPAISQTPENTSKNPAQDLQHAIQNQALSGSGKDFVKLMQRHCPTIRLSELPIEVAQMIMTSQHENIMEILDTWSKSIQEQAELDKEANKRSMLQKENLERSQKHRDAIVHALAARSSDPSPGLAPEVVPAVQAVVDNSVVVPSQDALSEPDNITGVQLRDR